MPEKAGKSGRNGADFFLLMPQMRTGPAPVISGAREPICRSHRKKENGKMVPHPRRAEAIKLSTKCRQLEPPKWKLPKKFPFWHRLNVKGGIPSPLHNPPMRVQALPHRFVYSLAIIRFSYRKRNVLCIIISPVLVLCFIHPQETEHDPRRGTRGEAGRAGESYSESSSHSRRISDPEKVNHDWGSLRAQRDLPSEWLRRRQAAKKMLPQRAGEGVSPVQASLAGNTSEPRPEQEEKVGKPYTLR